MFRSPFQLSAVILLSATTLFAAPKIIIEKTTFQCGSVIEGKTEKLHAQFMVKNTGTAALKINVRPGCGCAVVKYDSLVGPGKTSNIESDVNIKGYHSGAITKSLTVTSNDTTNASIRLEIQATIVGIIDPADLNLNFTAARPDSIYRTKLTSKMKDLKISEVLFKANENVKAPDWQNGLPLSIKFKWIPATTANPDGTWSGALELFPQKMDKPVFGNLVIKTNHPDKPEVTLQGNFVN